MNQNINMFGIDIYINMYKNKNNNKLYAQKFSTVNPVYNYHIGNVYFEKHVKSEKNNIIDIEFIILILIFNNVIVNNI